MGLKEGLFRFAAQLMFERPARKLTVAEMAAQLQRSGEKYAAKLPTLQQTEQAREKLRHVIGIERWGQKRLRAFLGEPFETDGHHPYKPAAADTWDQLVRAFADTRAETVRIAGRLASVDPAKRVAHNQFGGMTVRGWLRYLNGHAHIELKGLK